MGDGPSIKGDPKAAPLTAVPTVGSEPVFQLDGVAGPLTATDAVR